VNEEKEVNLASEAGISMARENAIQEFKNILSRGFGQCLSKPVASATSCDMSGMKIPARSLLIFCILQKNAKSQHGTRGRRTFPQNSLLVPCVFAEFADFRQNPTILADKTKHRLFISVFSS